MGRTTFTSSGLEGLGEEIALHLFLRSPLFSFVAAPSSTLTAATISAGRLLQLAQTCGTKGCEFRVGHNNRMGGEIAERGKTGTALGLVVAGRSCLSSSLLQSLHRSPPSSRCLPRVQIPAQCLLLNSILLSLCPQGTRVDHFKQSLPSSQAYRTRTGVMKRFAHPLKNHVHNHPRLTNPTSTSNRKRKSAPFAWRKWISRI
jgi:hypothetical protein